MIQAGANLELTNKAEKTVLDYAIEKNNLVLVSILLEQGAVIRNTNALAVFLKSQQANEQVIFCLGVLREQEGNHKEAKEFYQRALMTKSPYPAARRRLGEMYEKEGNISYASNQPITWQQW